MKEFNNLSNPNCSFHSKLVLDLVGSLQSSRSHCATYLMRNGSLPETFQYKMSGNEGFLIDHFHYMHIWPALFQAPPGKLPHLANPLSHTPTSLRTLGMLFRTWEDSDTRWRGWCASHCVVIGKQCETNMDTKAEVNHSVILEARTGWILC
jgi:hypothetical protein